MNTPATAGTRLSSNSIASPGLVVTRLRNISTAITPLPKRYSKTSWKAAKKMRMKHHHTILPVFLQSDIKSA